MWFNQYSQNSIFQILEPPLTCWSEVDEYDDGTSVLSLSARHKLVGSVYLNQMVTACSCMYNLCCDFT